MKRTLLVLSLLLGLGSCFSNAQFGIVDCIEQKRLAVLRIQGEVYDATGVSVPGAVVSVSSDATQELKSRTDANGQFYIKVPPGRYLLNVSYPNFQVTRAEVDVGADLLSVLHPKALRVILALPGINCPWVTTSNKEFKELVRNHATQK